MSECRDFHVLMEGAKRNHHARFAGEAIEWDSPDYLAAEAEEASSAEETESFFAEVTREDVRLADFSRLLLYAFGAGPDPRTILQRFIASGLVICRSELAGIGTDTLARLVGSQRGDVEWREVEIYGERVDHIDRFKRAIHQRLVLRGRGATWETPDIRAIEARHVGLTAQATAVFAEICAEPARLKDCGRVFAFFVEDGRRRDWRAVVQRLFAVAQVLCPGATGFMSKSDVAQMLGERKASASWRAKKVWGRLGLFVPGGRGISTQEKNAERVRDRHRKRREHANQQHS